MTLFIFLGSLSLYFVYLAILAPAVFVVSLIGKQGLHIHFLTWQAMQTWLLFEIWVPLPKSPV